MTGFAPNSAAAPATVGGKLAVIDHWGRFALGRPRQAKDPRARRPAVTCSKPRCRAGCPGSLEAGRPGGMSLPRTVLAPRGFAFTVCGVQVSQDAVRNSLSVSRASRRAPRPRPKASRPTASASTMRRATLEAAMGAAAPVHVVPTLCFANCERGCSAGISAPGKWSYMLGELDPERCRRSHALRRSLCQGDTGVVLPSGRPASLQRSV